MTQCKHDSCLKLFEALDCYLETLTPLLAPDPLSMASHASAVDASRKPCRAQSKEIRFHRKQRTLSAQAEDPIMWHPPLTRNAATAVTFWQSTNAVSCWT